jgi:hypothetical protein
MKPVSGGPWDRIGRAVRRTRADGAAAAALVVVCVVLSALLVGWWIGGWAPGWGPLLLVVAAAAVAAALVLVLLRRWVGAVTESSVAAAAERRRGLPEGSLRSVLELARALPPGVSAALFRRSEADLAARLADASPSELAGELGERARLRRLAMLGAVLGLGLATTAAGVVTPDRARAGWEPLLRPVAFLRGPVLPPLVVGPGNVDVERGERFEVEVSAPGRSQVTLEWQSVGEVPRTRRIDLADGVGATSVGPVDAVLTYRVRAPDGAASPAFRARPVDPLLLSVIALELVYPPHTGRSPERLEGDIPPLVVPEGTVLEVSGRATRALASATFRRDDGATRRATVAGETFSHEWRLDRASDGRWELAVRDADGSEASPAVLALAIVPDGPPRVRIVVPGGDTIMGGTRRQPVVADAMDDYGIAAAELVYRRVDARGRRGPAVRAPLPIEPGQERVLIRTVLDASGLPLGPGDAVEYHVVVRDNASPAQVGVSETYLLTLPDRAQLRDRARDQARALAQDAQTVADRARQLDRATRELGRRVASGPSPSRGGAGSAGAPMDHERASELRQLATAHEEARAEAADLEARLDALRDALAEAGLRDRDLERRLERLQDLFADLGTDDAERLTEALREAADRLDPADVAKALERLAAMQEEIRRRIEESLEQLEQAALEQEMHTLAREAEEIAAQQEMLASAIRDELGDGAEPGTRVDPRSDPSQPRDGGDAGAEAGRDQGRDPDGDHAGEPGGEPAGGGDDGGGQEGGPQERAEERAGQQEELARRTRSLNDLLGALQQQLLQRGDPESAGKAGSARDEGQAGEQSMQQAADQAREGKGEEAAESGEAAAGSMAAAARALDEARSGMGETGARAVQEAVQQATQDALQLAEREDALRERMEQAGGGAGSPGAQGGELQAMQSEQAAVRQGLEQLGRNLSEADRQAGILDREVGQALARAMLALDQTQEGLARGGQLPVRDAERAVDALNRLALSLLENDARMGGARGADVEEALRRLAELSREQGALNAQGGAFTPLDLAPGVEAERAAQMAESQRGIARRIGDLSSLLGGREDVLGQVTQLSAEAEAIARSLEGGRLQPETRARQERLFHRLLDAGRTLEREEYTEERVGETARAVEASRPAAVDPALLESIVRYPGPTGDQMRELSPAYRRLVLEYFQRLNAGLERAPPAGGGGDR